MLNYTPCALDVRKYRYFCGMGIIRNVLAYAQHSIKAGGSVEDLPPELQKVFRRKGVSFPKELSELHQLQLKLLANKRYIVTEDHGAGAGGIVGEQQRISLITRRTWRSKRSRALHYNLVKQLQPSIILELGTSFGFTSALFAMAAPEAKVYTIEGCKNTAAIAASNFDTLNLNNIIMKIGEFDKVLDSLLSEISHIDYLFIDGNHRMVPTLNYFLKLLPYTRQKSIFVFDDIHWSKEMNEAWTEIKKHPRATLSIEMFNTGILFFSEEYAGKVVILR